MTIHLPESIRVNYLAILEAFHSEFQAHDASTPQNCGATAGEAHLRMPCMPVEVPFCTVHHGPSLPRRLRQTVQNHPVDRRVLARYRLLARGARPILSQMERPSTTNWSLSPPMTTRHATYAAALIGKMSCYCATSATEAVTPSASTHPCGPCRPKLWTGFVATARSWSIPYNHPHTQVPNTGNQRRRQHPCAGSATPPPHPG
jgi:hypothetical protein